MGNGVTGCENNLLLLTLSCRETHRKCHYFELISLVRVIKILPDLCSSEVSFLPQKVVFPNIFIFFWMWWILHFTRYFVNTHIYICLMWIFIHSRSVSQAKKTNRPIPFGISNFKNWITFREFYEAYFKLRARMILQKMHIFVVSKLAAWIYTRNNGYSIRAKKRERKWTASICKVRAASSWLCALRSFGVGYSKLG